MKRTHLRIVRNEETKQMNLIERIKNVFQQKQIQKDKANEDFLRAYYTREYEKRDKGIIEIPHFLKAKNKVEQLKRDREIEETIKRIKRGIAC